MMPNLLAVMRRLPFRLRQPVLLLLIIILLAGCGGGPPGQQGVDLAEAERVEAFVGDLAASATASGRVLPERSAALPLETAGRVTEVAVESGEAVEAGDLLVQLDPAALELAVASAEQDVAVQEANLLALQTPALEEEVAAAEAAVASAQARLDQLLAGASEAELVAAEANLRAAAAGVWSASAQLGQAQNTVTEGQLAQARANVAAAQLELFYAEQANEDNPTGSTHQALLDAQQAVTIAQAQLEQLQAGPNPDSVGAAQAGVGAAAAQRDARQADLDLLALGASEAQIAAAEAAVAQAEASLSSLEEGPGEAELEIAQARLEQARLALADAQAELEKTSLRAPFAGMVTAVHVTEGEFASGIAVELLDMDSLQVVLSVDEVDVGRLEVGQPAEVTLETWPDITIESELVKIASSAIAQGSSLVTYDVYLTLEETDLPVRAGMTANASLVTAQRDDVLLVPNRAIIADRERGTYYVNLLIPGEGDEVDETERVEVAIGQRDENNTQILSGLTAGDTLVVGDLRDRFPGRGGPFGEGEE